MAALSLSGRAVLVTGGAGFIGSHLVARLLAEGAARVVVLDSLRYGDLANLGASSERVELVRHELGSGTREELDRALRGVDVVFHLAAEKHNQSRDTPERVVRANIEGTVTLLEACHAAGVRRIVYTSSLYAYGRMAGPPFVETELPEPRTVYGMSKLAGEHLLRWHAARSGCEWNVLRYLFVYGPRQFAGMGYKSVIVRTCERLLAGEAAVVHGDGEQTLDYVYVDDAVEATLRAMTGERTGEVFNVGSGRGTRVVDLVAELVRAVGGDATYRFGAADWTAGSSRVGDVSKIAGALGWSASVPLAAGLRRTLDWTRTQPASPDR